jgi:hypothetical protein
MKRICRQLLISTVILVVNSVSLSASRIKESFTCIGQASLKNGMPNNLSSEIKMLLKLLTPIDFTETFYIEDAQLEGAKIRFDDSKITLAQTFNKKIGTIDTNITQLQIDRFSGTFYLEGKMTFQEVNVDVVARGNCKM